MEVLEFLRRQAAKGGKAAAARMTPEQRRERARKAAAASAKVRSAKAKAKREANEIKKRRLLAYHEAGHAVMADICKIPISRVELRREGNRDGAVVLEPEGHPTTWRELLGRDNPSGYVRAQIRVSCGGIVAQEIFATMVLHEWEPRTWGIGGDIDDIQDWDSLLPEKPFVVARRLRMRTRNTLLRNWDLVEAVAEALLNSNGELSGSEVKAIIRGARAARTKARKKAEAEKEGNPT